MEDLAYTNFKEKLTYSFSIDKVSVGETFALDDCQTSQIKLIDIKGNIFILPFAGVQVNPKNLIHHNYFTVLLVVLHSEERGKRPKFYFFIHIRFFFPARGQVYQKRRGRPR